MEYIEALNIVIKNIKNDKELYYVWQSNIACQFQDALQRAGYRFPDLQELSNEAAKGFLDLLDSKRKDSI
jgi:hypothetical protein